MLVKIRDIKTKILESFFTLLIIGSIHAYMYFFQMKIASVIRIAYASKHRFIGVYFHLSKKKYFQIYIEDTFI